VNVEGSVESGHGEHGAVSIDGTDEAKLASFDAEPARGSDEDSPAGVIESADIIEIDDHVGRRLADDDAHQVLAQGRKRGEVDFAGKVQHGDAVDDVGSHAQIHGCRNLSANPASVAGRAVEDLHGCSAASRSTV
jgi:hypothetical protein